MLPPALTAARNLLESLTPLQTDCGQHCGGACCVSHPGEQTGMLLFPGEEAAYIGLPTYALHPTDHGILLTCHGACDRSNRPLACRIFPLVILLRDDGVKVATDAAALSVCPLARQGKSALSQDFVAAVRQAGMLLAADDVQRMHLQRLTAMHDEWKALRAQYGPYGRREPHV